MKRTTNPFAILCAASLVALVGACAGNDSAAGDSAAGDTTQAVGGAAAASDSAAGQAGAQGALLDPNTATRDQLVAIPGMDAATADAIVAGRPYENMLAVDRVLASANFSEAKRDSVYERMFKPLDLNTATKEEIMLIPGVGERMQHEFEEYRPYRGIEQFRREIGKYVDEQEVARLERYVTIR